MAEPLDSPARGESRWDLLVAGCALSGYGFFFWEDLGWPAYGVVALGVFVATIGGKAHAWARRRLERLSHRSLRRPVLPPEVALSRSKRHFWLSLVAMLALGAFSLWRVHMTVWRPLAQRMYFFPANTWLGRLEHSWFNDFLYAFGMVGILYVLYTIKEFIGSRIDQSTSPLFSAADSRFSEEQWRDHQDRSRLMIGTGIVIILAWAWLEEIGDLVPGYIFDKWDINAIYLGFILGYSMMHHLSYPIFAARPPFHLGPFDRSRWLDDGIRFVYVAFVWAYTALMNPTDYAERWMHVAELSALVLASMWLLDARRRPTRAHIGLDLSR